MMTMMWRKPVLILLCLTVFSPIVLYTDRLSRFSTTSDGDFGDEASVLDFLNEAGKAHAIAQETSNAIKEPNGVVYYENSIKTDQILSNRLAAFTGKGLPLRGSGEHKSRVLSAAGFQGTRNVILSEKQEHKHEKQSQQALVEVDQAKGQMATYNKQNGDTAMPDARVRHLRDQLIRSKVYLSLGATRSNLHFNRELRGRTRDVQRALGDATKDSELPKNAFAKLRAMERTLAKGKQIQDDYSSIIKKLRAMLHYTEEQIRAYKKEALFLTQLAAKSFSKGLHCLPLRLSSEYYSLDSCKQQFPYQEKLDNPKYYHYALFSDNILAAAVVVNSTVINAKHPADHVFHIVTDRLNYASMRMWFLANPPGNATIQIQSVEEFTWLNANNSSILEQLGSQPMIDYYFRTHHLNHLWFYLPEIFPTLKKVVLLADDIVVQKDLSGLWRIDLKGKVNGAVETCGESFHRFDKYLNFSNPLIAKNFLPHACVWAYGMNVLDLVEWRNQNITEVYHSWQKLNHDRLLWKLGTLPPGLITFWNRTYPLDASWHVLGLGYNPTLNQKDMEQAAVIHYNGILKPWLETALHNYRGYWSKYLNFDQLHLRECNINA